MSTIIYGIKNCDTMKKARTWLEAREIPHYFHDYKVAGIDTTKLETWCEQVGWEVLLNRSGTTFRSLPEKAKQHINEARAIELMVENPSMIKRPVLEYDGQLIVGFQPERYEAVFGS